MKCCPALANDVVKEAVPEGSSAGVAVEFSSTVKDMVPLGTEPVPIVFVAVAVKVT
jgi:hypothetical protein